MWHREVQNKYIQEEFPSQYSFWLQLKTCDAETQSIQKIMKEEFNHIVYSLLSEQTELL